jgi:hypothetical protein
VSQRSLTSPTSCFSADRCSNYADGLVGKHQAYYRENEGGLASLANVQGDRLGSPLPEPLLFPPAPPQEGPGISIPEALQPRLRPHTHNRRLRIYPNAGPELHHHRHRALAARRRVPTPRPSLRQGRCEAGKTGTVDQRRVERPAAVKVLIVLTFAATLVYGASKLFAG